MQIPRPFESPAMRFPPTILASGLIAFLLAGAADGIQEQARPTIRVFADFGQALNAAGPVGDLAGGERGFGIAVPMPANCRDVDLLPSPAAGDEDMGRRLGYLRIEAAPESQVAVNFAGGNTGTLRLYRKTAAGWQRLERDTSGIWTIVVDHTGVVEAGVGVVLPEARDASFGHGWPGKPRFAVVVRRAASEDEPVCVPFRVAPFVIPCSLDPVDELLVVAMADTAGAVKGLEAFAGNAGVKLHVHPGKMPVDQWMQDTIEPGVFAFPVAGESVQVRAALTGLRREFWMTSAGLDRQMTDWLRESEVVTVVAGDSRKETRWIDWFGNLEVTPSHTDANGQRFPYGRVLTGKQNDLAMHPGVMGFLEAQQFQWPPVVVDTSWLLIGHVDEVINFVPAKNEAGFKVLLPSPHAARELLDKLLAAGHGELPVFEGSRDATTVRKLRETIGSSDENQAIDETVASIREQLQRELSLNERDFVMLPVLFERGGAVIPNAVNSAVVNGHVLAPAPRGPRHQGVDLFETAIREAFADCAVDVHFIDAWRAYHVMGGEVHCGTNTFRRLRDPAWWDHADKASGGE